MALTLVKKGQSVNLTKDQPNLEEILIGLSWDVQRYQGAHDFDLDATLFIVDENGKCKTERDVVFYHPEHLTHPSGAVQHSGDERKGAKEGFDETITVNIKKLPAYAKRLIGVITIYEGKERKQNFGMVANAMVKLINNKNSEELYEYDLGEEFSIQTAVKVFEIYEHKGEWKFKAVGDGYEDGLARFVEEYGLSVEGERK